LQFSVITFPGSNCDHDCFHVAQEVLKQKTNFVWHEEKTLPKGTDVVVLPGGFSYGDYLRTGAIAKFSPIMEDIIKFANNGGYVIGICNGFQVLTESGLLPGALLKNRDMKFICKDVNLKVANNSSNFTKLYKEDEVITIPIAHGEGNFEADEDTLKSIQDNDQIAFQYVDSNGKLIDESNPNGSQLNIAGILNKNRNVLGMMPHPERCSEAILGNTDGFKIFESLIS
jgi:phosphoribosylformylglycinamidine synthase subunit PurQ / glutaminase